MGQALYRKYRSKNLSEIVGQEHIVAALDNALKTGRISHAYLFTGPRGTGKTSIARILAHEVNGLPYSTEPNLDIIEIDAASNRRIDEIRELRDKVYIAPAAAKYKVYIIDEVHMLTREAFNALLKTLEEPPEHVIFILATTDAHKLPATIISRTQRYNFKPVETAKVAAHLAQIAKAENIKIDPAALELLAQHGEGSFRDSISLLDQISNLKDDITAEIVQTQLGLPPASATDDLINSLGQTVTAPIQVLQGLFEQGYRATAIAEQLGIKLRQQLTSGNLSLPATTALRLLKDLLAVPAAHNPERYLELVLMETASQEPPVAPAALVTPKQPPTSTAKTTSKPSSDSKPTNLDSPELKSAKPEPSDQGDEAEQSDPQPAPAAKPKVTKDDKPEQDATTATETKDAKAEAKPEASQPLSGEAVVDEAVWPQVLGVLKKRYNTIYGIVRMAQVDFSSPGQLTLNFKFAFHQKRLNDAKNKQILTDAVQAITGYKVAINSLLSTASDLKPTNPIPVAPSSSQLAEVSAIFGGGELL